MTHPDSNQPVPTASATSDQEGPPISVLHVINGEHYAGAERVQDLLATGLREFGFRVGQACLKPDQFPQKRRDQRAPLYDVAMQDRFDLRPIRRLTHIVHMHDYRLLHAHTPRALLMAAGVSFLTGVPLVYHVHSPTSRDTTRRWRNRINALIERICWRAASAVITVSESLKEEVRRTGGADRKVFVVHNGVPCGQPRSPVPTTRKKWTLGTVALFRPRKGLEVLLDAVALVRDQGWPVRLRVVGRFETPQYERQVKAHGETLHLTDRIDWVGFARNTDAQLARMDLFVLPSLFGEGLPLVVLEAMAAGVPVLATRVEGIPEAIRDGEDGLLVEPGNAADLARVLLAVIRGKVDCEQLRHTAHQRQAAMFSDRSMVAGVAQVYREVLAP